ncbi:MAG: hypothetical protein SGJ00_08210 [bacterium]|nr:hypothetical protein [bacterium]
MNLLFAFFISFFLSEPIAVLKEFSTHKIDTVKTVSAVKTQYLAIDAKRKIFSQYSAPAKESGSAYFGYYEGTKLRMINANFYTDSSKVEADEYLNEMGSIILVYAKNSNYETKLSINPRTKINSMTENWFYFNNEVLIKWVRGGKVVPSGLAEFKQMGAALRADFPKHKKQFVDFASLQKIR